MSVVFEEDALSASLKKGQIIANKVSIQGSVGEISTIPKNQTGEKLIIATCMIVSVGILFWVFTSPTKSKPPTPEEFLKQTFPSLPQHR